jgi:hypothetical protein
MPLGSLENFSSGGNIKNCTDSFSDQAISATNRTNAAFRALLMSLGLKSNTVGGRELDSQS